MSNRCSIILWLLSRWDICHSAKKMGKMSQNCSVRNMGHWDSCPIKIIWKKNWNVQQVFYHFVTSVTMGHLSQCQKMGKMSHNCSVWNMGHWDSCPIKIIWKKNWVSKRCSVILWLLSQWDICHRVKKSKKSHTFAVLEIWDCGTAVPLK